MSVVTARTNESDKVQKTLSVVVQRFRGVIGRTNTLSDNPAEVPPEGLQHALVLTVYSLLSTTANFGFVLRTENGGETGFSLMVQKAEQWLNDVKMGLSVTYPTNPQTTYPELIRYGGDDVVDTTAA